jgi:hypothetical protein
VNRGDVVSVRGRDFVLEAGWLLSESGGLFAVIFGVDSGALLFRAGPAAAAFWLEPLTARYNGLPHRMELGSELLDCRSRVPVAIERFGNARELPQHGLLAAYSGPTKQAWLLSAGGEARAWSAEPLTEGDWERWGAGDRKP